MIWSHDDGPMNLDMWKMLWVLYTTLNHSQLTDKLVTVWENDFRLFKMTTSALHHHEIKSSSKACVKEHLLETPSL